MTNGACSVAGSSKLSPLPPGFINGPPSLIINETTQNVIKFNIMVTTISLMLNLPFRKPAIDPSNAPPKAAAASIKGIRMIAGGCVLFKPLTPKANRTP